MLTAELPGVVSVTDRHIKLEGKQGAAVWGHYSWVEGKHLCRENTQCTRKATEMPFRFWKRGTADSTTAPATQMVCFLIGLRLLLIPYG